MDRKYGTDEVYRMIKDRKAYNVARSLEIQLSMISGGAKVHSIPNLINSFGLLAEFYKDNSFPKEETIAQLKKRTNFNFNYFLTGIVEAKNDFGVQI